MQVFLRKKRKKLASISVIAETTKLKDRWQAINKRIAILKSKFKRKYKKAR